MTYYEFLSIPNNAILKEIKIAYKTLAIKYHPDKGGDHEMFIKLQKAYETLIDPVKRSIYDNSIRLNLNFFNTYIKKEARSPLK